MKKLTLKTLFASVMIILITNCEEPTKPDVTPPTVAITAPSQGQSVYEIVTVTCIANDNKTVKSTELWISGVPSGLLDDTEPYSFEWNTMTYKDGQYTLTVRVYDESDNAADSVPINVIVDNTLAAPATPELYDITYANNQFFVSWSINEDDDFSSFELYESMSQNMSEEKVIYDTNVATATSYTVSSVSVGQRRYYRVKAIDSWGFESYSEVKEGSAFLAPLVFIDDFEFGIQGWRTYESDGYWVSSVNGKLQIGGTNDSFQHYAYTFVSDWTAYEKIASPIHLVIDVKVISEGTEGSRLYGIGLGNDLGRYFFLISSYGNTELAFFSYDDGWNKYIDWFTPSPEVTFDDKMHLFYDGNKFEIYLNYAKLGSYSVQNLMFDSVYLYQQTDMIIQYDNVELYGNLATSAQRNSSTPLIREKALFLDENRE
jgi:hypothetical protein|tara:strand:- start:227 stop:1516 length:1290 start_codon:yes stop_codon:yes gene_type:complete